MSKPQTSLDYANLSSKIYKTAYKLSEVQDKIEKVAFDIVRFKDNDMGAALWQVQAADDGEYIVSLYEPEEDANKSNWEVVASSKDYVQIYYKNDPIVRVAVNTLGAAGKNINKLKEYLPKSLTNNKKLVASLLNQLPQTTKKEVLNKYPELS